MTSTDQTLERPLPPHAEEHPDGRRFASSRPPAPHPLGPLRPVVSRWWLVLPVMLAFAGGGAYVANQAQPTYSASATINVGRTDVRVQALPGYAAGATSLAAAYTRIVQSAEIEE